MPAVADKKAVKLTSKDLETIIDKALKKIGSNSENDICRYLPVKTGGYMHHFTMRKMKRELPEELGCLIKDYIVENERPRTIEGKRRAPRGSRKRSENISFNRSELEHMLRIARLAGDKELIAKLTPKRDLKQAKRSLLASIRQERIEPDLWQSYCEIVAQSRDDVNTPNKTN